MSGLMRLLYAESVDEIEDAFYEIPTPTLNLIYATVDNHIGYYA
jgi:Penicillin amidase